MQPEQVGVILMRHQRRRETDADPHLARRRAAGHRRGRHGAHPARDIEPPGRQRQVHRGRRIIDRDHDVGAVDPVAVARHHVADRAVSTPLQLHQFVEVGALKIGVLREHEAFRRHGR